MNTIRLLKLSKGLRRERFPQLATAVVNENARTLKFARRVREGVDGPPSTSATLGQGKRCMARLFTAPVFAKGGWAPELKRRIASRGFIPAWHPKSRIWRGTYERWVQFEPSGWSGPFFWSGKPTIRAVYPQNRTGALFEEALVVGYYVERGTPSNPIPEARMDQSWHWHGFYRCLTEPTLRDALNALMLNLSERRRTLWMDGSATDASGGRVLPAFDYVVPYVGPVTLDEAKTFIDKIPPEQWINVMLGNRFPKSECLSRDEEEVVGEFRTPIIRAQEIHALVDGARPARHP